MLSLIAVVVIVLVWAGATYNLLVRLRNMLREAWSGIDVQLKRRHDLVPNLVESVKAYSSHERDLFEGIAEARSKSIGSETPPARGEAETQLGRQLKALLAIAESYPDLKASANFVALQKALVEVEDDIQYARRYYNATVRDYNISIQSFPALIIANVLKLGKEDYFEIEYATERQAPDARFD